MLDRSKQAAHIHLAVELHIVAVHTLAVALGSEHCRPGIGVAVACRTRAVVGLVEVVLGTQNLPLLGEEENLGTDLLLPVDHQVPHWHQRQTRTPALHMLDLSSCQQLVLVWPVEVLAHTRHPGYIVPLPGQAHCPCKAVVVDLPWSSLGEVRLLFL